MKNKINIGLLIGLCLLFQVIGVLSAAVAGATDQVANNGGRDRNEPSYRDALVKECGHLGVMAVPEGAQEHEIRHCANHPQDRNRNTTGLAMTPVAESDMPAVVDDNTDPNPANLEDKRAPADVFARDDQVCNTGPPYGCSDSYCWRECGADGRWCWIAEGDGGGPWRRCSYDFDCRPSTGGSCGVGCISCGCSC